MDPATGPARPASSRTSPASPIRGFVSWSLGLGIAAAAAVGPALAEAQVQSRLRDHLDLGQDFAIDVDLAGLELRELSRALPGAGGKIEARSVRVRPSFDGLVIEVEGLRARTTRARRPRPNPGPGPAAPGPNTASHASPAPAAARSDARLIKLLHHLRGVPIEIVTHGEVVLEIAEDFSATIHDPAVELPGHGAIHGRGQLVLSTAATPWAAADIAFETSDDNPLDLGISGSFAFEAGAQGSGRAALGTLSMRGRATPKTLDLALREADGGEAQITVERQFSPGRDRARIDARRLPLALLEPVADLLGRRVGEAIGEHEGKLDLSSARISGAVELVRGGYLTRARFDAVELESIGLDSQLISAKPIHLDGLSVDGELAREHTPDGPRSFGTLNLGHGGVELALAGQIDAAGVNFEINLPEAPCQAILDATPGLSPVLAGTELSGTLAAHFALDLDYAALDRARARYLGDDAEPFELEDFEAPGKLDFALPYLERCHIETLGPGADVAGLAGPYHHRFISGAGVESQRVLATGDANYVDIDRVPRLALAFVILEDARYWQHDGFDREQIERAFWFNLLEGRVSRGASTITQQAARSLWLGIDRSMTRKLAEAVLAAELERGLDKRRILELYLNIIELGPEVHGVVEASRYHFGKEPRDLDLIEALHLASLAPAPVAYSRRFAGGQIDPAWREHLRRQVRRLRIRHLISPEQADEAMRVRLRLRPHPELAPATHRGR